MKFKLWGRRKNKLLASFRMVMRWVCSGVSDTNISIMMSECPQYKHNVIPLHKNKSPPFPPPKKKQSSLFPPNKQQTTSSLPTTATNVPHPDNRDPRPMIGMRIDGNQLQCFAILHMSFVDLLKLLTHHLRFIYNKYGEVRTESNEVKLLWLFEVWGFGWWEKKTDVILLVDAYLCTVFESIYHTIIHTYLYTYLMWVKIDTVDARCKFKSFFIMVLFPKIITQRPCLEFGCSKNSPAPQSPSHCPAP